MMILYRHQICPQVLCLFVIGLSCFFCVVFFPKESLDTERTDEEIADNQGSIVG